MPYYNMNNNNNDDEHNISPTLIANNDTITASTPNLADKFSTMSMASTPQSKFSTLQHRPGPHFYTNAAPTKIEGNVFRYDFDEQVRFKKKISDITPNISPLNSEEKVRQFIQISLSPQQYSNMFVSGSSCGRYIR